MCAVSHSSHVCCVTQQTVSAVTHSKRTIEPAAIKKELENHMQTVGSAHDMMHLISPSGGWLYMVHNYIHIEDATRDRRIQGR